MRLRVGTKRSPLAKAQADHAIRCLLGSHPNLEIELFFIASHATNENAPEICNPCENELELQQALLDGVIDVAVHNLKDMPSESCEGTLIAAVLSRADPRDALITSDKRDLRQLDSRSRLAMSSLRRRTQITEIRSDLQVVYSEGNLQQRIKKTLSGQYDGVILGVSGLARMDMLHRVSQIFSIDEMVPAPGQGAIALSVRNDDASAYTLCSSVNHEPTRLATIAERAFADLMQQEETIGIGAFGHIASNQIKLIGMCARKDGSPPRKNGVVGTADDPYFLGKKLAKLLAAS